MESQRSRNRVLSHPGTRVTGRGALALLWLCLPLAAAAEPFFIGLGHLSPNALESVGESVSTDGQLVAGHDQSQQGFRWSLLEGMIAAGPSGQARDVSDTGVVIGVGNAAWRWTQSEGTTEITSGAATGVSQDGDVVVGVSDVGAFRWTAPTGPITLGFLAGDGRSNALDVSKDGSVVVGGSGEAQGSIREAFRWTAVEGMRGLGMLPGRSMSSASAVSGDGVFVVGTSRGGGEAGIDGFLWSAAAGLIDLGDLEGGEDFSIPSGVSDTGVVVGRSDAGEPNLFEDTAFLWDAVRGMRPLHEVLSQDFGLDLTNWRLENASDISPDGRFITGTGTAPDGATEAWLAFLPEGAFPPDADVDGVPDDTDNCTFQPNGLLHPDRGGHAQRDTDQDGYGNLCDADFDNDGVVGFLDLGSLKAAFLGSDPHADLNGDGFVDFLDLGSLKAAFFQAPGPSAQAP